MENSIKFTLAIDKINKKIAENNIKISKNPNDKIAKENLQTLLNDKNIMYKGNRNEFEKIIKKYGSSINE